MNDAFLFLGSHALIDQACVSTSVCGYIGPSRQVTKPIERLVNECLTNADRLRSSGRAARTTASSACVSPLMLLPIMRIEDHRSLRYTQGEADDFLLQDRAATAAAMARRLGAVKSPDSLLQTAAAAAATPPPDGVGADESSDRHHAADERRVTSLATAGAASSNRRAATITAKSTRFAHADAP